MHKRENCPGSSRRAMSTSIYNSISAAPPSDRSHRHKSASSGKPVWDSTTQDHNQFREDNRELERRRMTRVSKHLAAAKAQLAANKKDFVDGARPRRQKQEAEMLHKMFLKNEDMLGVLARTDRALSAVQDVFATEHRKMASPARTAAALKRLCPGVELRNLELPCPLDDLSAGIVRSEPLNQLPLKMSNSSDCDDLAELKGQTQDNLTLLKYELEAEQLQDEAENRNWKLQTTSTQNRRPQRPPWRHGSSADVFKTNTSLTRHDGPRKFPTLASGTPPELRLTTIPAVTANPLGPPPSLLNGSGSAKWYESDYSVSDGDADDDDDAKENMPRARNIVSASNTSHRAAKEVACNERKLLQQLTKSFETIRIEVSSLRDEVRIEREKRAALEQEAVDLRRLLDAITAELLQQEQRQSATERALRQDLGQLRWDLHSLAAAHNMCVGRTAQPSLLHADRPDLNLDQQKLLRTDAAIDKNDEDTPLSESMFLRSHTSVLDQIEALQAEHKEAQLRLRNLLRMHHGEDGGEASEETESHQ